jgi:chromosome segregation ATPase
MVKTAISIGFAIALLGVNVYVCTQFGYLTAQVKSLKGEIAELRSTTHDEITVLKNKTSNTSASAERRVFVLQQELQKARAAAAAEVGEAKVEATARAEELARQLKVEIAAEQQKKLDQSGEQIKSELTKVREVASTVDAKINQVHSEVTTVKTQIAADKTTSENQAAELKRVIGELGIQSDRIATNKKEFQALRAMGERNYFEFKLERGEDNVKVADIRMSLKKADTKRGKFTVELVTADRRFQRKDRNANEPIQFYVNKTRQPHELVVNELYELVVNDIHKDSIAGYLSTPKIQVVRR